ncbi:NAD-dependent deacetylase-like protein sirtuin-5 [Eremomyces bilateralis CBS 781.70]|uniref:NAD-dependent deacetylase-like protein sirtuin-5 n=1 Tax=Eremomyces bilateralis CBS 781.70 TaxID=1392243 RepID=A0A6G1G5W4_9PEZI|nr:NAD-dependent deacetylase-like protein sirtuin-5 [Eremomyces bilateralis CBS 781.70]KAF1813418.1 NAD-dependent deacetylase-like protein sirtuin-5 [Eremomyces bilateralis CBS 781.70]
MPHAVGSTSQASQKIESFAQHLAQSKRVLALLGAGLSASSGLPTFRGAGGLWRTHEATQLATPEAFEADPGLVWQFYSYRRHMSLGARPNRAHYALAEYAKRNPEFITLSQNVDGLSQRAGHPSESLHLLHGNLFTVKCTSFYCGYTADDTTDPIVPALAIPTSGDDPTTTSALHARDLDIADAAIALPEVPLQALPHCPKCKDGMLRPGVVWFGERLPEKALQSIEQFVADPRPIDLIMVVGTSARVFPAASYVDIARTKGARVAVFNTDANDAPGSGITEDDWFFCGDAAQYLPELLKGVIGDLPETN